MVVVHGWQSKPLMDPKVSEALSLVPLSPSLSLSHAMIFYLPICLYVSLSVSTCLPVYLSFSLSLYLSTSLSLYLSIYRSICVSIDLSIYLSVYLSKYLSIYLYEIQSSHSPCGQKCMSGSSKCMFENVCENQAWDRYPQDVYVSWYVHMLYTILKLYIIYLLNYLG